MDGHHHRVAIQEKEEEGMREARPIHLIYQDSILTIIPIPVAPTLLRGGDTEQVGILVPGPTRLPDAGIPYKNNNFHLPHSRGTLHESIQLEGPMVPDPLRKVSLGDLTLSNTYKKKVPICGKKKNLYTFLNLPPYSVQIRARTLVERDPFIITKHPRTIDTRLNLLTIFLCLKGKKKRKKKENDFLLPPGGYPVRS